MSVSEKELDQVVALAHLTIDPDKKATYLKHLNGVLDDVKAMDAFDLSDVAPMAHVLDVETPMRDDVVVVQDDLLMSENAPAWEKGCFSVPQILNS